MPSNDDYRRILERPDMTDAEVDELHRGLQALISQVLDEYFREELESDDP